MRHPGDLAGLGPTPDDLHPVVGAADVVQPPIAVVPHQRRAGHGARRTQPGDQCVERHVLVRGSELRGRPDGRVRAPAPWSDEEFE